MLLGSYRLIVDDPAGFVRLAVLVSFSLIVAITVHEFSHAMVANGLGDSTAKRLGRVSLNPLRHLDPGGTMMLLVAGFGWGKPVPVDPGRLAHGKTGNALVAAAGPLSMKTVGASTSTQSSTARARVSVGGRSSGRKGLFNRNPLGFGLILPPYGSVP